MKIHTLLSLKWKSFFRNPLIEQAIMLRLLIGIYIILLLAIMYMAGVFFEQFAVELLSHTKSYLALFIYSALVLFVVDFALKFLLKKSDNSQYVNLLRFYNSRKGIRSYMAAKEFFSLWNYYLLIFFFAFLKNNIQPDYGLLFVIPLVIFLCLTQILISLSIGKIKSNYSEKRIVFEFSKNIFPGNAVFNYLLLNVKMILRSPRLAQQLLVCLLYIAVYLFFIQSRIPVIHFSAQVFITAFFFALFPLLFNQFLFSAEASFFDYLMIIPDFKKILTAKYVLYLSFSGFTFFLFLFTRPFSWIAFVELTAISVYSIGTITLLSFCCILFVDTKMDLFGSFYKIFTNTQSLQAFIVGMTFFLSIGFVILMSWLFSPQTATWFMLISGGIFILCNQIWFNYLYKCFYPNKYEKMEIFRIQ